ncbi:MAG: DUF4921 family protein [Planctomycetaceae bacterium]
MSDAAAGSEIRHDPVRGHTTIIAPNRGRRPNAALRPEEAAITPDVASDPFLAGNEHLTTEELFSIRNEAGDWSVRVIRNKYPALTSEASGLISADQVTPGTGQHEVIVECPHFETELANLPVEQIGRVLTAWQSRLESIRREGKYDYALIFKNSGRAAGTSLPHSHSQLIATAHQFHHIQAETDRAKQFYLEHSRALLEDTVTRERNSHRVLFEDAGFVAFCPFASRFSHEVWIAGTTVPFHRLSSDSLTVLGNMLHSVLNAIQSLNPQAAYNILLHATPFSDCEEPWFRWRIEICPRVSGLAGFELATGCYINSVPPEDAARNLRDVLGR